LPFFDTLTDFKGPQDWIGILFNYIAISYPFLGLIMAVVYVVGRFDPMYLFVNEFNFKIVQETSLFFILRLYFFLIYIQWMLHSARTCIFITVGMSVSFIRVLLNLIRLSVPNSRSLEKLLHLYRELSVLLSLLTCLTNKILGNILALAYLLIAGGMCCFIYGVKENDPKLIIVFLFIIVGIFLAVLFLFRIGGFIYSSSILILKRWRNQCSIWQHFKGKILVREIDCCRLLTIKAGEISVVTRKLQQGFLNALLQDSITFFLIWKNKMNAF